uniref:Uncharacterized protein n=1 Tax=Ditylenchus dipsaci TaxID=166011 RepID=A0A915DMX0_9BILA
MWLQETTAVALPQNNGCSRTASSSSRFLKSQQQTAVELPLNASETVLECLCKNLRQEPSTSEMVAHNLRPFLDGVRFPVCKMDLSGLNLSERILAELLAAQQYSLMCLDLSFAQGINSAKVCSALADLKVENLKLTSLKLTSTDLLRIPKYRHHTLRSMRSFDGHVIHMSSLPVVSEDDLSGSSDLALELARKIERIGQLPHFMKFCPNIEHLYLLQGLSYNIEDESQDEFLARIFDSLSGLKTLDISEWQNEKLLHLRVLSSLHSLTTLVLYDVHYLESAINSISGLQTLVSLDVSQSERITGQYTYPVTALHTLITRLPNLKYLDISGTNLIAAATDEDRPFRGTGLITSDIAGLSFLKKPLKYLGIFNCDNAPHFMNIPAEKVCGDHGEDQIVLALEVYMHRPRMMQAVLNESYQLYRFGSVLNKHVEALHLVLKALSLHKTNSSLQIAGSASMFYIIRNVKMNRDTKRSVIYALLNGMENHIEEQVMVRNCCLSLCQFEIPQEVLFNYGRAATLLVRVLEMHSSDQLTQRIVVFLLNSMACHVEGDHKIEVGTIGAIEIILEQIRRKHAAGTCDDVMEVGWSFLWNITDETQPTLCYSQFPNETELVRNMMGLIGNIAEVEHLRGKLMDDNYLKIFNRLLDSLADGIEISYNSAGVLAHLVSDGEHAWQVVQIRRSYIMEEIIRATNTWDLAARRFINYRSFKPILRLLPMFDSPGSQHWAVWALANLTSTDVSKYCRFVEEEGGEDLLIQLVNNLESTAKIRQLASLVLTNLENWRRSVANAENDESTPAAGMDCME